MPTSTDFRFDIPSDATAPAAARRAIEGLGGRIADDLRPDVLLLVSELVSNSVKYSDGDRLGLAVSAPAPREVRVEVIDNGSGFQPVARTKAKTEVGGWGLHLVGVLADRWGVYEGSTHVWFEIRR